MAIRVVVFDAFGTLVQIGERRSPYRKLMRWMRDHGRKPQANDASQIMPHPVDLAGAAALFGVSPPIDLLAGWGAELQAEQKAGYRIGLCSNLAAMACR